MGKVRCNFTIDSKVKNMLSQLSGSSSKLLGRHCSMSEILEILIRKQFLGKEKIIKARMLELQKELSSIYNELEELQSKNKRANQEQIAITT